jgi:hypothetical protein
MGPIGRSADEPLIRQNHGGMHAIDTAILRTISEKSWEFFLLMETGFPSKIR